MQTTSDIRSTFLDYFAAHGHENVDSSPLVPQNDPTLMFTNAGMVQFKDVFTGKETRPYSRAVTSQKCVRAGGKHNDLDNVGYTARHHTFFEMLGNFSFGDYFKDTAIDLAWKLVTQEFGLPKDKLLVTVHTSDEDAADIWKKVAGISDDRIIRIPTSDNFWSMGDTGPCGPCSEIFYDHGEHIFGGPPGSPDEDGDRFIEIWNLVFMQFDQISLEERIDLPKPSIDTGMGLERIAAIMQGKHDNYDIDLMRNLIESVGNLIGQDPDGPHSSSFRVIADHLRSSCFLIADGVLPSNEGRGYVLRRIMRRAMRHAHMLGFGHANMFQLVPALQKEMGQAYPELIRADALISETLKLEEQRFRKMLDRGLGLLEDETADLAKGGELAGDVAFKLYDTYGFPLDLTQDALREKGMTVDVDGFQKALDKQRADARAAWSGTGDAATEKVWFDIRDAVPATEFLGYTGTTTEAQVLALVKDGVPVESVQAGDKVSIIVNQTSFYAESGGQAGDTGQLTTDAGVVIDITDTQKRVSDLHDHIGTVVAGTLRVGDDVRLVVEGVRRDMLRANHSATHLLHAALRKRLGNHVTQRGSMVSAERLRFDISHQQALTAEELRDIEADVNAQIRANTQVSTRVMDSESAIEAGAMALFGEKYGDEVRVVAMGAKNHDTGIEFSVELCGGIHVQRTGDIGAFKIVLETAVGSGIRRIEAVTGRGAEQWIATRESTLLHAAELLKVTPANIPERILALQEDRKKMEKEIAELRKQLATGGSGHTSESIGGYTFVGKVLDGVPAKDLKGMADELKKQIKSGIVALIAVNDGKVSLVVGVTDDIKAEISAVDLVKAGAAAVGGKGGGGRPDMAQAGGPDANNAAAAIDAIKAFIEG